MKTKQHQCPVCGSTDTRVLHNYLSAVLAGCLSCGSNYLTHESRNAAGKKYDRDYFTGNHARTYGKTYLQDGQNIRSFARRRLNAIRRLLTRCGPADTTRGSFHSSLRRSPRLLDFGSALGIFCDESVKAGFESVGVEISSFARSEAKKKFRVKCVRSLEEVSGSFDVITAWFTLEHTDNPRTWIGRFREKLAPGGILALSFPNGRGAFARFAPDKYFSARPAEHVFEPAIHGIRLLLESCGFRVVRIEIFGLHPDRIGLPDNILTRGLQKILRLGDTFEIYAKKISSPRPRR